MLHSHTQQYDHCTGLLRETASHYCYQLCSVQVDQYSGLLRETAFHYCYQFCSVQVDQYSGLFLSRKYDM